LYSRLINLVEAGRIAYAIMRYIQLKSMHVVLQHLGTFSYLSFLVFSTIL